MSADVPAGTCFRVEYDLNFWGGDYRGTGQFAYVPLALLTEAVEPEEAFERHTGFDRHHIVHYMLDETYDAAGRALCA